VAASTLRKAKNHPFGQAAKQQNKREKNSERMAHMDNHLKKQLEKTSDMVLQVFPETHP